LLLQDIKIRLTDLMVIRALLTVANSPSEVNDHNLSNLDETATTTDAHIPAAASAAENGVS
jgi:hypothetical protein